MMTLEEARTIVDNTRKSIAAQQHGGLRSDDPSVRADARLMSLQSETFADRHEAKLRLQPVVDPHERVRVDAYNAAVRRGANHREAWAEACRVAKPLIDAHEEMLARRRRAKHRLEEQLRARKLEAERELAKQQGFR
jgi:hypothetical protein